MCCTGEHVPTMAGFFFEAALGRDTRGRLQQWFCGKVE